MARDAVTINDLTRNGAIAEAAGTTIVVANGAEIDPGGNTQGLWIVVKNTNGSDRVATVLAGDDPPAKQQGQGNLAVTVPATSGVRLICVESGRFIQNDGKIHVDFAASFAGTIQAYRLPKGL